MVDEQILRAQCYDCGRKYGEEHGFPDLVIPDDAWKRISPDGEGNGLLCPSCICQRLHNMGIVTTGRFTSGPLGPCDEPSIESERDWHIPSRYRVCRGGRGHCPNPPVADMRRSRHLRRNSLDRGDMWWAYCADHLRGYNREVRDGRVWWLGFRAAAT